MAIKGGDLLIFEWCMVSFCLLLILFRFTIRLRYSGRSLSWGDLFVFLAWCVFVSDCAMDVRLNRLEFFDPDIDPLSPTLGREIAVVETLKLFFVENVIYLLGLYAVKFSVLCFYREIIPRTKQKTTIALLCISVYTVIGCIVTLLINVLSCLPVSRNWSTDGNEACNSGWSSVGAYVVSWMFHLSTDLLIYFLPLTLLPTLRLSLRQKIGVGLTFGLGFLCLFFASAVIAASFLAPDFATSWIMCTFEQTWAITVVCVPSFRALAFWSKRQKTAYHYGSDESDGASRRRSKASRGASGVYAGLETELEAATMHGEEKDPVLLRATTIKDDEAKKSQLESVHRLDSGNKFSDKDDIETLT